MEYTPQLKAEIGRRDFLKNDQLYTAYNRLTVEPKTQTGQK